MISSASHDSYLKEQRLRFIRTHQDAFDVEPNFPLPIFEEAVINIKGSCGVEPTCHVEGNQLFAGDFQVANYEKTWPRSLTDAFNFLDRVESRVDVKINRKSLEQFAALHAGSHKIKNNTIGIDLRPRLEDSSIKVYIHLNPGEGDEHLVMTGMALDDAEYSDELIQVLVKDVSLIGFNLFLDGRSTVEIWASSPGGKYQSQKSFGRYLATYIRKNFSPKVISLFDAVDAISVSFPSRRKIAPLLYFFLFNIKDIPQNFAFNSLGEKIYDFVQSQDCITYTGIAAKEQDLQKSRLEKYHFLYNKSDTCQLDLDFNFFQSIK